jgi:hypothetical protein
MEEAERYTDILGMGGEGRAWRHDKHLAITCVSRLLQLIGTGSRLSGNKTSILRSLNKA